MRKEMAVEWCHSGLDRRRFGQRLPQYEAGPGYDLTWSLADGVDGGEAVPMTLEDDQDSSFHGCKIALIHGGEVLSYVRDHRPDIPFSGNWDLPGGGREGGETPEACVLRELDEEFALHLDPGRLAYRRHYPDREGSSSSYFFGALLLPGDIEAIRFGSEGQAWRMMPCQEFLAHPHAVPHLKERLGECIAYADRWVYPDSIRQAIAP
jgi:8-oxo-dGTP diphosphatase